MFVYKVLAPHGSKHPYVNSLVALAPETLVGTSNFSTFQTCKVEVTDKLYILVSSSIKMGLKIIQFDCFKD